MAFTHTTSTSAAAWRPDLYEFAPADVIAEAAVLRFSTVVGNIEGDAPVVRVAFVDDDEAQITAEGNELDEAEPSLSEVEVRTSKITMLVRLSREQYSQQGSADQLAASVSRAIIKRADELFFNEPVPTPPATAPAAGLVNVDGVVDGGEIADNLDALTDLVAQLQANKATPSAIILDPLAWGSLRKLKVGTDFHSTLLGAGTADAEPRLLGLPVDVNHGMPAYSGIVVDRFAVVSAVGNVVIATSLDQYFSSDSVAVRATFRMGVNVTRPSRLGVFTVAGGGS
jgi:HK97 family phage major capsid protein